MSAEFDLSAVPCDGSALKDSPDPRLRLFARQAMESKKGIARKGALSGTHLAYAGRRVQLFEIWRMADKLYEAMVPEGQSINVKLDLGPGEYTYRFGENAGNCYVDADGFVVPTHVLDSPDGCEGAHCPIHDPSDHHMVDWELVWKDLSRSGSRYSSGWYRRCKHGRTHPDPDEMERLIDVYGIDPAIEAWQHDCDGCCKGVRFGPYEVGMTIPLAAPDGKLRTSTELFCY